MKRKEAEYRLKKCMDRNVRKNGALEKSDALFRSSDGLRGLIVVDRNV